MRYKYLGNFIDVQCTVKALSCLNKFGEGKHTAQGFPAALQDLLLRKEEPMLLTS